VRACEEVELRPGRHDALVDVTADHELDSGRGQRAQRSISVREWELPRCPPGRAGKMVMERDDSQRRSPGPPKLLGRAGPPRGGEASVLMPPGPQAVEPADDDTVRPADRVSRADGGLEGPPRRREACGGVVRQ